MASYNGSYQSVTNIQDLISYYLMGIATTSICCVGIVGNILSLIILSKPCMRTGTTHMYLIALAISDTLVLIFTILTALKDTRPPQQIPEGRWLMWKDVPFVAQSYPTCHALAILFQVNSVWLTVAFSADRYFVICHPFTAERRCTRSLAILLIFLLFLLCVGYNMPRFFENEQFRMDFPSRFPVNLTGLLPTNETFPTWSLPPSILWYHVAPFGASKSFRQGYHLVSWLVFVVLAPFVALAVMNSFLIREVRRSYRRGRSINATERRRNDTNVMLISVIVLFFICQVPAAINHVLWGFINESDTDDLPRFLTNEIGNFLVILNSAINIIPYYFFGRKFRQEFTNLFCPCKEMSAARLRHLSLNSMDSHAVQQKRVSSQTCLASVDGKRLLKVNRRGTDGLGNSSNGKKAKHGAVSDDVIARNKGSSLALHVCDSARHSYDPASSNNQLSELVPSAAQSSSAIDGDITPEAETVT